MNQTEFNKNKKVNLNLFSNSNKKELQMMNLNLQHLIKINTKFKKRMILKVELEIIQKECLNFIQRIILTKNKNKKKPRDLRNLKMKSIISYYFNKYAPKT